MDHYMASILAEALEYGYFSGFELDQLVSLVNCMLQPFCNPSLMMDMMHLADETRLRQAVDTILAGLKASNMKSVKPHLQLAKVSS